MKSLCAAVSFRHVLLRGCLIPALLLPVPLEPAAAQVPDTILAPTPRPGAHDTLPPAPPPVLLPTLLVVGHREGAPKELAASLAHRGLALEALAEDASLSSVAVPGASSMLYRDIPAIGTVFFRHGEPILFDTQENLSIESTFPSYHLRLRSIRSDALHPASDLALELGTQVEEGVRSVVTPFRVEAAGGTSRPGARGGVSVAYRQVPELLLQVVDELGALGEGPRVHLLGEVGDPSGNLLGVEFLASGLTTDYSSLFGYQEYHERQDQGYLFLRGQRQVGSARAFVTAFRQEARTSTRTLLFKQPRQQERTLDYRGVTVGLIRGDTKVALRRHDLERRDGDTRRAFDGFQVDAQQVVRWDGTTLSMSGRLDILEGDTHTSLYAIASRPVGRALVEVGGGRLFDPLTPNRHGVSLLDLPGSPATAPHQETMEGFVAVEGRMGGHSLRGQVQPRLIRLPHLAGDLRVEGITWRLTDRVQAGPYHASATLAIHDLELRTDDQTTAFPATADREFKGVVGRDGRRTAFGLAAIARQGVRFPGRGGEVRDIGDQFIVNGSAGYTVGGVTLSLSAVNLTGWLGARNPVALVWENDQERLVDLPSIPNLSLQWRM